MKCPEVQNAIQQLLLNNSNVWLENYLRFPEETLDNLCNTQNIRNLMQIREIPRETIEQLFQRSLTLHVTANLEPERLMEIRNMLICVQFEKNLTQHLIPASNQLEIKKGLYEEIEESIKNLEPYSSMKRMP